MFHYGDQTIRQKTIPGVNRTGTNNALAENTKGRDHCVESIAEEVMVFTERIQN